MENLFSYCILTTSEEGEEIYLDIYCAGSGPAVGGMSDDKSRKAAKALVDYVRQAEPADYTHKAYYLDGPTALEFWNARQSARTGTRLKLKISIRGLCCRGKLQRA